MSELTRTSEPASMRAAEPLVQATTARDYPSIAAGKYRAALERVSSVHARFQNELDSVGGGIERQNSSAAAALGRFRQVGPHLDSIAESIKGLGDRTRAVGAFVREGREGLKASIAEVREAIGQLEARGQDMRGILDIGKQVTDSVNEIAEIAIENKVIAINASITASKASDKVKGFKVIAAEITRLSATMSESVGLIVERAARVAEGVRRVIDGMDESVRSTRTALGNIDEAFGLLDHVERTVAEADTADQTMLDEQNLLSRKARTLDEALAGIAEAATTTGARARAIQEAMTEQAAHIARAGGFLPRLEKAAAAIASAQGGREAPKVLRCSEVEVITYDPALTRMLREMHYVNYTCIRLLRYSSDKKIVPYLAETWFLHPDGRTWEFRLKRDVRFHDGSPVSCRDVKFSLERLMAPALASPYANLFSVIEGAEDYICGKADSVAGIVIVDELTLRIRLKSSFNFFLSLLALSYASILKYDPSIRECPLGRSELISAGPFRFAPSDDMTTDRLIRNESFVNGRPFVDVLEIRRSLADVPAELANGGLDLAYNMPAASADRFRELGFDGELRYYTSRYCYGLVVNFARPGFLARDAELRRALAMSIDRDFLADKILGAAAVRADAVLPPEMLDIGGRQFIPYDPDEARRIVESYRSREDLSKPIELAFRGYATIPRLEEIGRHVVASFERLGLKVNASFHPATASIPSFRQDYDLVFLGFLSEIDLYSALEPFINPEGGDNYFHYDNPAIFGMLNDSIAIKDEAERRARFVDILERLTLDVFMMPLFFNKAFVAIRKPVHEVFLSAEESFVPEVAFKAAEEGESRLDERLASAYAEAVGQVRSGTEVVARSSSALIGTGREIGSLVSRQKASIGRANGLFSSFAESAAAVQTTRLGVMERIRDATVEARKSGRAAGLILEGLRGLSSAVEGSVRSLDKAMEDIGVMLATVRDIGKSNEFIGSIAVNAAVISAKTDSRGSDLVKVSHDISEQARRNTANTEAIRHVLEDMGRIVGGHSDFLEALVKTIDTAAAGVRRSGDTLDEIGPLLESADRHSAAMASSSTSLEAMIREALISVAETSSEIDRLAVEAETLQFGLDMEQSVVDILEDMTEINESVRGFLERDPVEIHRRTASSA